MPTKPTPNPHQATIIVNPVSGKPGPTNRIEDIKTLAKTYGWRGDIAETTQERGADAIIDEALSRGVQHFVVCGGDGTISQAVAVLAQKPAVLGVVPGGTGNLFAQNLDIPTDHEQALAIALTGQVFGIDVGVANGTFFTIMAGMGLDADMIQGANRQLKNRIGVLAYMGTLIKNIPQSSRRFKIAIDGSPAKSFRAKTVMVANLGRITGGLEVVPHTNPQNGSLQVGIVQTKGFLSWINLLGHGLLGHVHHSDHYTLLQGNHIQITCVGHSQPFECDGNIFPAVPELVIDVLPKSLWVMTP